MIIMLVKYPERIPSVCFYLARVSSGYLQLVDYARSIKAMVGKKTRGFIVQRNYSCNKSRCFFISKRAGWRCCTVSSRENKRKTWKRKVTRVHKCRSYLRPRKIVSTPRAWDTICVYSSQLAVALCESKRAKARRARCPWSRWRPRRYVDSLHKRAVEIELRKARYPENGNARERDMSHSLSMHHTSIIITGTHKADGNNDRLHDMSTR